MTPAFPEFSGERFCWNKYYSLGKINYTTEYVEVGAKGVDI